MPDIKKTQKKFTKITYHRLRYEHGPEMQHRRALCRHEALEISRAASGAGLQESSQGGTCGVRRAGPRGMLHTRRAEKGFAAQSSSAWPGEEP